MPTTHLPALEKMGNGKEKIFPTTEQWGRIRTEGECVRKTFGSRLPFRFIFFQKENCFCHSNLFSIQISISTQCAENCSAWACVCVGGLRWGFKGLGPAVIPLKCRKSMPKRSRWVLVTLARRPPTVLPLGHHSRPLYAEWHSTFTSEVNESGCGAKWPPVRNLQQMAKKNRNRNWQKKKIKFQVLVESYLHNATAAWINHVEAGSSDSDSRCFHFSGFPGLPGSPDSPDFPSSFHCLSAEEASKTFKSNQARNVFYPGQSCRQRRLWRCTHLSLSPHWRARKSIKLYRGKKPFRFEWQNYLFNAWNSRMVLNTNIYSFI